MGLAPPPPLHDPHISLLWNSKIMMKIHCMRECVLYTLYYGPCGLKTNDFRSVEIHEDDNTEEVVNVDLIEVRCPENVVRKED